MTAPEQLPRDDHSSHGPMSVAGAVIRHVERTCRTAIDGRRASRALAEWTRQFALGEAEFQLLWLLRTAPSNGCDQASIGRLLSFSPAQVSATVERMRMRGWLLQQMAIGDRRRRLWQLSAAGRQLLDQMLSCTAALQYEPPTTTNCVQHPDREAAA